MKNDKLPQAFAEIDDDLICEADRTPAGSAKRGTVKWGWIAASLLLIIGISVPLIATQNRHPETPDTGNTQPPYQIKHVAMPSDEVAPVRRWDEMPNVQRYASVEYEGTEYTTRIVSIPDERLGIELGDITATGFDMYEDAVRTMTVRAYSIRGIADKAAICVRFGNEDRCYAYANSWFTPETLADFIDAIDMKSTLSTGVVYDQRDAKQIVTYEDIPTDMIWNMLLADPSLKNEPDHTDGVPVFGISANVDLLGYRNVSISLSHDGYLRTNILDSAKAFYIGTDAVDRFLREVTESHQGYLYIYDPAVDAIEE